MMLKIIGNPAKMDAFRQALFFNISSNFKIIYDDDLDLNLYIDINKLSFTSGQSFVNAKKKLYLKIDYEDDFN